MGWLSFILGLVDPVTKITKAIADTKIAMANATTDQERIHSVERLGALQARQAVMIAEAGQSRINAIMRGGIALAVNVIIWKLLVWDKALGQWTGGRTDALSPELWQVITAVIGFYFLYEGAIGVTRIIKR